MNNNYGGYQNQGNNPNMNSMFQNSNFMGNQNGPNMNQNNNNFNLQESNSNISLAQSQAIPIRNNSRKLNAQLTQDEQMFYSKLYNMLDNNNSGRILGKPAANFMKSSNLKKNVLKEIWLIAAQSSNTYILREEFFVAMRLIALAQNNMPYTAQSIEMNNPIPPLAQFNLNNLNNNNQNNNNQNNQNCNNNSGQNIYEISEQEKTFFKNIFDKKKEPNAERITAHNAIIIWKSNNADDNAIKIVANIIKPLENKGFLNLREFQVASHLITISKKAELPQKLPDILINYLGRNNNNFNNNDYSNSRMNTNPNLSQFFSNNNNDVNNYNPRSSKQLSNSPFLNNDNNNSNSNDRIQEIFKKEEELTKKSNILNNQIDTAKNKINDLLKEIELIQKRQDNINSELIKLRQECNNLRNNGNSNNLNNNNCKNNDNNLNNPLIKKNLENIGLNMRYDSSDLNNNNELINNNFAPPVNQNQNDGYPNIENKKPDLMDLMNKMDLNVNNNNNNGNNNFNNNMNNNFNKNFNDNNKNEQKNLDFELEDNLKINEQVQNPYEMGNSNKNDNKIEDNGSNQKNEDDEWDF